MAKPPTLVACALCHHTMNYHSLTLITSLLNHEFISGADTLSKMATDPRFLCASFKNCGTCKDPNLVPNHMPIIPHPLPLPQLLLSHSSPLTHLEKQTCIQSLLCIGNQIVAHINRQHSGDLTGALNIDRLSIGRNREEQPDLMRCWNAYLSLLAPIRTVPDDVLMEIFLACTGDSENGVSNTSIDELEDVCKRWKDVALGTPSLWSNIKIVVDIDDDESFQANAGLLHMYACRARTLPIQLSLEFESCQGSDSEEEEEEEEGRSGEADHSGDGFLVFAENLVDLAPRLQGLSIVAPPVFLRQLEHAITIKSQLWNLPKLESFELEFLTEEYVDKVEPLQMVRNADRLRRVTTRGARSHSESSESLLLWSISWDTLKSWHGLEAKTADLIAILRLSPNLTRCDGARLDDSGGGFQHLSHGLESLDASFEEESAFRELFEHCDFPSLQELSISSPMPEGFIPKDVNDDVWFQPAFTAFLHRSACPLQRLVLSIFSLKMEDLLATLTLVPGLVDLEIFDESIYDEFLLNTLLMQQLTVYSQPSPSSSIPTILPNLHCLSFGGRLTFTLDAFLCMANSRLAPGSSEHATLQLLRVSPYKITERNPSICTDQWVTPSIVRAISEELCGRVDIQIGDAGYPGEQHIASFSYVASW
ncbi:hypothetical protein FIBSPDRAFT_993977 [Athelia psychrophila]|uniref:Uncharacterized protein n=1 Tax=Athelia psychrophila TaxID=1759441 RepID=A0A165Y2B9_9AGAM|nr:hypothetical protein FIBSPDRAFT_993977 [Fibularhizoctonia sp. CBS 109695]